jgi:hypothetical protein
MSCKRVLEIARVAPLLVPMLIGLAVLYVRKNVRW